MERIAVIDLGTNTFHLLVAEPGEDNKLREVCRERFFVKLGEEGLETIGEKALQRGLAAIKSFREKLDTYRVNTVRAFGTAALRTATNGPDFIREVETRHDIHIQLISGEEEAYLIHRGVKEAVPFGDDHHLIIDIGGGSVEFIIANRDGVQWTGSYLVGLAVLYRDFHSRDPISTEEIESIHQFLDRQLSPLLEALERYPVSALVGASGVFDVLEQILGDPQEGRLYDAFSAVSYFELYGRLIGTSLAERRADPQIPDSRADMIIVALILIEYALRKGGIEKIIVSSYALKEGILYGIIENDLD